MNGNYFALFGEYSRARKELSDVELIVIPEGTIYTLKEEVVGKFYPREHESNLKFNSFDCLKSRLVI